MTKKEIQAMPNKRMKKWYWVEKEMDWQGYTGSNKKLNELLQKFSAKELQLKKKILIFTQSEEELKYKEAQEIICSGSLLDESYLNDGVSIRQFGKLKFT